MMLQQIGVVHSPYKTRAQAPRQGRSSSAISEIEIFPQYAEGLHLIDRNRYLIVLSWFHLAERDLLSVTPPHRSEEHGVFATRSPARPNPIALSLVKLRGIEGNVIRVAWLEAVDGTPVIDIKPYSRELDCAEEDSGAGKDIPE
ncbi:MAG TPA: tRNA (N6-threonylcarbamoyladenosine(37)-N6)-methyltransferase TrmO [Methanomicrobiales archaeon]|nr:tRNA (N6-threonylcarbamoyladenosine(37)-N6)-methyltransferase TrmO [Methanomicrobiales archaeon]